MGKAAGRVPKAISSGICVLYDPTDGRILHIHQTVVLAGAKAPGKSAVERKARAQLKSRGIDASTAKALHIDRPKLRADTHYEVDIATGRLVAVRKLDLPGQPPKL